MPENAATEPCAPVITGLRPPRPHNGSGNRTAVLWPATKRLKRSRTSLRETPCGRSLASAQISSVAAALAEDPAGGVEAGAPDCVHFQMGQAICSALAAGERAVHLDPALARLGSKVSRQGRLANRRAASVASLTGTSSSPWSRPPNGSSCLTRRTVDARCCECEMRTNASFPRTVRRARRCPELQGPDTLLKICCSAARPWPGVCAQGAM